MLGIAYLYWVLGGVWKVVHNSYAAWLNALVSVVLVYNFGVDFITMRLLL